MSMEVSGVTLPDIPADKLAENPFALIVKGTIGADTMYVLAMGQSNFVAADMTALYGISIAMPCQGVPIYYTCEAGSAEWTLDETLEMIPVGSISGASYDIIWANHDIKFGVLDMATFTVTPTDEIAFLDSTVAVPDRCYAPGTFFLGIADEVRRLTGKVMRYTADGMKAELRGVKKPDTRYDWLASSTLDSSTNEFSSDAETLEVPNNCSIANPVSANLPNAKTIGQNVFTYCYKLTSVNAPLVTRINSNAFNGCSRLATADFPNCEYIGGCFQDCTSLKTVNFPVANNLQFASFYGCSQLEEASFPAMELVENSVFNLCTSLRKLDLGVTATLWGAFQNCTALETLILRKTDSICKLKVANCFNTTPIKTGTGYIYVPSALVNSYKAATNWSTYADKIRAIEDYPDICGTTA